MSVPEASDDLIEKQKLEQARIERIKKEVDGLFSILKKSSSFPWKHNIVQSANTWRVTLSYKVEHSFKRDKWEEDYLVERKADSDVDAHQKLNDMLSSELDAIDRKKDLLAIASMRNESLDFQVTFSCPEPYCVEPYIEGFSRTYPKKRMFIMEGKECDSRSDAIKDLELKCYKKWATPKDVSCKKDKPRHR